MYTASQHSSTTFLNQTIKWGETAVKGENFLPAPYLEKSPGNGTTTLKSLWFRYLSSMMVDTELIHTQNTQGIYLHVCMQLVSDVKIYMYMYPIQSVSAIAMQ